MDSSKIVDKWHNDGSSVLPKHSDLNPGPEGTRYDLQRHEQMKLKNVRYGFFKVATQAVTHPICINCEKEILGSGIVINGVWKHYGECPK